MKPKQAAAPVTPVRQRTQYSCMSASMAMCLNSLGHTVTEDEVNDVMGARPMKGAAWEQALACAQHYGCRATLTMPATVTQLKEWTDQGIPVMIAWNPEGRPWSHASVVFDVDDERNVHVADPNIPNPERTVRVVSEDEFYGKWYEKWPDYMVRRPACAIEREITVNGRQTKQAAMIRTGHPADRVAEAYLEAKKAPSQKEKDKNKIVVEAPAERNPFADPKLTDRAKGTGGAGAHKNRPKDVERGKAPEKHKKDLRDKEAAAWDGDYEPDAPSKTTGKFLDDEGRAMGKASMDFLRLANRSLQDPTLEAFIKQYGRTTKLLGLALQRTGLARKYPDLLDGMAEARNSVYGETGEKHPIIDKYKRLAQSVAPAVSAPRPVTDAGGNPKIQVLNRLLPKTNGDARLLVERLLEKYEAGLNPSDDELKQLRHKLYQTGMRSEADMFRTAAANSVWEPMTGPTKGWKHADPEILAYLTWDEGVDYVKDRDIPDLWDINDPELLADGIPELIDQYDNTKQEWEQWKRQGWWPKPVKVKKLGLRIIYRPANKMFEAELSDDVRQAMTRGAQAIEVIRGRKYPPWMKPSRLAAADSRYKGNPDGKPVYNHVVDHGVDQPLSGGFDVMKQLQNEYLKEQGRPERENTPRLARFLANTPDHQTVRRYLNRTEGSR